MSAKKYTWAELVGTLIIPKDEISQNKYKAAIEYCYNFYCEDKNKFFTEAEVKFITEEISDEAAHKIQLAKNDLEQQQIKKDWPGVDAYVNDLLNRGPYPG